MTVLNFPTKNKIVTPAQEIVDHLGAPMSGSVYGLGNVASTGNAEIDALRVRQARGEKLGKWELGLIQDAPLISRVPLSNKNGRDELRTKSEKFAVPFVEELTMKSTEYGDIPNKKGLFVNGRLINFVGKNYEVVQPVEVMESFERVCEKTGLEINGVVPNYNNAGLLLSAKYSSDIICGDQHDTNLVFYTAHDGKYKTFLSLDTLRINCFNQLPMLYRGKERFIINERHYRNHFNFDEFEKILEDIPESIKIYAENQNLFESINFSKKRFIEWYVDFAKVNTGSKRAVAKLEKVKDWYDHAQGQEDIKSENLRKALNCITWINTHTLSNTEYKTESLYTKYGDNSLKAMDSLLKAA